MTGHCGLLAVQRRQRLMTRESRWGCSGAVEQFSTWGILPRLFTPGEFMKKVSYVLAALATIAIAAPAVAQDKPMMGKEGIMHHSMHHHKTMMHHETRMMHHKKMVMKKDGM
jgi:hypothetical protein